MNRIFSALVRFGELLPGLSAEEPRTAGVDVLGGVAHRSIPPVVTDNGTAARRATGDRSAVRGRASGKLVGYPALSPGNADLTVRPA